MPDDERKMAILDFTLSEEGVLVFHDVLACVLRFSEDVCLEARKTVSKSAYASFNFTATRFFSTYEFTGSPQNRDRFFCSLYIRSLLSVFRTRLGGDPSRERDKETTIDHCEVTIDDAPGTKSRLVAKIVSRNGITATHALPFESKPPVHAKFDKDEALNHWSISSRTLRQLMDHFGPGIELLDINTEDESVVNFCCFTEKVVKANNAELLKKPLQTSIAVDKEEFDDLAVQDKLHIIVNVKDFRAILHHAQSTSGDLSARYSNPGKPMKLFYSADGMLCEFVLMTIGDRTNLAQKLRKGKGGAMNGVGQRLEAASTRSGSVVNAAPAPPPKEQPQAQEPASKPIAKPPPPQFEIRPPPLPPISTLRSESLFVMQPDEDQEWEPMNHDDEEDMGETTRLEWDASGQQHLSASTMRISDRQPSEPEPQQEVPNLSPSGLEPTQRLAEVRRFGLFSP